MDLSKKNKSANSEDTDLRAGFAPEQKLDLIEVYQDHETRSWRWTGDGVNDAPR